MKILISILVITMFLLSGCSQKIPKPIVKTVVVTKVKVKKIIVPEELLVIQPIPKVPSNITLQSQVAKYIVNLYNSAKSCVENEKLIKEWNSKNIIK